MHTKTKLFYWMLILCILVWTLPLMAAINDSSLTAVEYHKIIGRGMDCGTFRNDLDQQTIDAIKARGFNNLRIRVPSEDVYTDAHFDHLAEQVDRCLSAGIVPIIAHGNKIWEAGASESDRIAFVDWWSRMATKMAQKSEIVSYNLWIELSNGSPIREDMAVYKEWMQGAINVIRAISPTRIIMLPSPTKTSKNLMDIPSSIYENDDYMMVEWHLYASGPNHGGKQKNWVGDGSADDKANVTSVIEKAQAFTNSTGIPTWFGAWMPFTNNSGTCTQYEAEAFGRFMLEQLSIAKIPWSANAVDHYYTEEDHTWRATEQMTERTYDMAALTEILATVGNFIWTTDPTAIEQINDTPTNYSLSQNYPNPFNPTTSIKFNLPQNSSVYLIIYNSVGQKVATLANGEFFASGSYNVEFNATDVPSGIYFYTIKAGIFKATNKMLLIK